MLLTSIFNRIFGSNTAKKNTGGIKLHRKNHAPKRLTLEPLESRDLLAVVAGWIDDTRYAQIRSAYSEFNLPELQADINILQITPDTGEDSVSQLNLADLKSAITTAATTALPDLILVKTSTEVNTITYTAATDEITINIDATQYGSITLVGLRDENLTLDANQLCRVITVSGTKTVANLSDV